MTQRHEVSKYCRKSDADRLARHKVVTKLQFVKKKKKNPLFAKCNKRRYACITLIFHSIEDLIKTTELGGINLFHR